MRAFSDAGVYLFVDLDTFNTMIDQDYSHWNETQQSAFQAVMDEFQQYDNTAGFFIGNEAIRDGQHSQSAIYVKAATRDLKAYRQQKGYRDIPVGYSHADISSLRPNLQNYLACGTNASESIDFFGLNAYEWCGASSFSLSGYSTLENQAKGYPVPIFLSETGCNQPEPRDFQDQTAIFGPEMDQDWSGAIIYEWINEGNGYGLVAYDSSFAEGTSSIAPTASIPRSGTPTPVTPDYSNLKKVWASATPNSIGANAYNPNLTPPPCPASTPGIWEINGQASLPAVGQDIQQASQTAGTVTFSYAPLHPDSTSPSFPFSTFTDLSTLCPNGYIFAGNGSLEQVNPVENKTILLSSITGSAPSQTGTPGAASGGKVRLRPATALHVESCHAEVYIGDRNHEHRPCQRHAWLHLVALSLLLCHC